MKRGRTPQTVQYDAPQGREGGHQQKPKARSRAARRAPLRFQASHKFTQVCVCEAADFSTHIRNMIRKTRISEVAAGLRRAYSGNWRDRRPPCEEASRVCALCVTTSLTFILDECISKTVGCCRKAQHRLSYVHTAKWVACRVHRETWQGAKFYHIHLQPSAHA